MPANLFVRAVFMSACLASAAPAFAGIDDSVDVHVDAGELSAALLTISQQGRLSISFAPGLVEGRRVGPIQGRLRVRDALERVLAGTNLQLVIVSSESVSIVAGAAPASAVAAPPSSTASTPVASPLPTRPKPVEAASTPAAGAILPDVKVVGVVDPARFNDAGFQAIESGDTLRMQGTRAKELPMTVNTVTQEVLRSQVVTDVIDALKNVPGVTLGSSTPDNPTFTIRGFQSNAIYSDGTGASGFDSSQGSNQLPIDDVERVDVLKGPTSILTGSTSSGGAISVELKRPTSRVVRTLTTRYGTDGYKSVAMDVGGPVQGDDHFTYRLNASATASTRNYAGYEHPEEYLFSPSVQWDNTTTSVLAGLRIYSQDRSPNQYTFIPRTGYNVASPFIPIALGTTEVNPELHYRTGTTVIYSELTHDFGQIGNVGVSFKDRVQYQMEDDHFNTYSWLTSVGAGAPSGTYRARQSYYYRDYTQLVNQASLTINYATDLGKSLTKFGLDYSGINTAERLASGAIVNINPLTGLPLQPLLQPATNVSETQYNRRGIDVGYYLLEKIDLFDNRLHFFGQARTDRNRYKFRISSSTDASVFEPRGNSWIAGAAYDVLPSLTLYGSRSVGFLPINSVQNNGELVQPERRTQSEVGGRLFLLEKRLTVTASHFDLRATNVSICDPVLGCDFITTVPGQSSKGYEVDVQGEVYPGVRLIASASKTDAQYQSQLYSFPLAGVPKYTGSFWGTYRIRSNWLENTTVGLGLHTNSTSKVNSIYDNTTLFDVPGSTTFDAMLGYDIGRLSLQFKVNNLTNKYYYRPSYTSSYIGIAQGRSALIQARYAFD